MPASQVSGRPHLAGILAVVSAVAVLIPLPSPSTATPRIDSVDPGSSLGVSDAVAPGPRGLPCPAGAVRLPQGGAIAAAAEAAPPGTTFCIGAGVHRGVTFAPKDGQRFFGEPGAVLDGSRILDGLRKEGGVWIAQGQRQESPRHGTCLPERPACDRPETVYLDGQPLEQVETRDALGPGRFFFDYGGDRILLADDPSGRLVEASAVPYAFLGNGARDVVVSDLVVEKYGNPAQRGAIFDDQDAAATGWRIEHNEVRLNGGLGILAGRGSTVRANLVHHNGQLGISLSLDGILIEGNRIAFNNTGGFDPAWEGGGLKGAVASNIVIRGNEVYRNKGPGLWCDIGCRGVLYEGNTVSFNDGAGIFHEISFEATIRGNRTIRNGTASDWYWGANILVAGSENVLVEGNDVEVADDGTAIALVDQGRDRVDSLEPYRTAHNLVRRNRVRFDGRSGRTGGVSDVEPGSVNDGIIESGGNLFEENTYSAPPGCLATFGWGQSEVDFEGFQSRGQDIGSTFASVESEGP